MKQSIQSKEDIALGRFLSLVLRHQPQAAGITLDRGGWADIDALIKGVRATGRKIDRETLERIVRENNKQRYVISEDGRRIRANQGHSIAVELDLHEMVPPPVLYHGTARRFLASISSQGITRQKRQYVHLSCDVDTARQVGSRHGVPVVLTIDAAAMYGDGVPFFRAANGVWLCQHVPWQYVLDVK